MSHNHGFASILAASAALLSGCVVAPALSVAPGPNKTYADLVRDDAACRAATPAQPATGYYQCMAAHGEQVVQSQPAYPAYAAYPYYPYYPYAPYAYPYAPFVGAYPVVDVGIGFGYWGGFHHGWHGRR